MRFEFETEDTLYKYKSVCFMLCKYPANIQYKSQPGLDYQVKSVNVVAQIK